GKPVSAVLGLTVTDDAVLEMIDKREQAPSLPVMVLLEPEVKDLADAAVYLDAQNPKARLALDLLLATQGWRRFAIMDAAKLIERHGDDGRRALALRIQARVEQQKAVELMEEDEAPRGGAVRLRAMPMPMMAPVMAPVPAPA